MTNASFDQIAALVSGVKLPLEPIGEEFLDIVVEGLSSAFEDARAASPTTVASASEAAVTALMETHLNRKIDEDPFWRTLVASVGRGTESVNFDGTKLEKRPDLSITFSERSRRFPLIVEAKIIDHGSGKTSKLYCDNGIARFLNGDYAWGCQEAFMLAYVRDASPQLNTLQERLSTKDKSVEPPYGTLAGPSERCASIGDLAITRHARSFTYPCQSAPEHKPGDVHLWHLWLG